MEEPLPLPSRLLSEGVKCLSCWSAHLTSRPTSRKLQRSLWGNWAIRVQSLRSSTIERRRVRRAKSKQSRPLSRHCEKCLVVRVQPTPTDARPSKTRITEGHFDRAQSRQQRTCAKSPPVRPARPIVLRQNSIGHKAGYGDVFLVGRSLKTDRAILPESKSTRSPDEPVAETSITGNYRQAC